MAIGTPGGDNQEQTILQAFLNIVEFWPEWYPNLHDAFRWPRVQTLHFYGSFWPHPAGFNKLNVESDMPEAVFEELKTKGHDVSKIAPASIPSCATAVLHRSGERQPHRGRRSAARLLRDRLLTADPYFIRSGRPLFQPPHPRTQRSDRTA